MGAAQHSTTQFHLQQNATAYVPRVDQRTDVARDIRSIFNAPDRAEAERLLKKAIKTWQESAPRLAVWLDENLPEGFTVFDLPPAHRRRLRTSNLLERLSRAIGQAVSVDQRVSRCCEHAWRACGVRGGLAERDAERSLEVPYVGGPRDSDDGAAGRRPGDKHVRGHRKVLTHPPLRNRLGAVDGSRLIPA
ncbi:MAG: hypothetical protein GY733_00740, partial [bacterium]|nr:hypothetical protein [bacterium]